MYSKLSSNLIHSTVWREPNHIRILWITMLAICDRNGVVSASLPGLADAAKISLQECVEGLKVLEAPDEFSRTKDYRGARISKMEGGWLILNYCSYRDKKDDGDERVKARERKRKQRARKVKNPSINEDCHARSRHVTDVTEGPTSAPAQLSAISAPAPAQTNIAAAPPAAAAPVEPKSRKKPTGEHHELIDHWCQAWERRYGKPFPFQAQAGRNAKHIQALLVSIGFTESAAAMDRYLECEDGFLNGHPLGMLVSQLSKFVVEPAVDPDEVGPDGLCAQDRKMIYGDAKYVAGRS